MSKKVSNKEEIKKQQKLREEELKQIAIEAKQRKKKTIIASSVVIVVVAAALIILISYLNYELPSAADMYTDKTFMVQTIVDTLKTSLDDESAAQITIYLNNQQNTDGDGYRVSLLSNNATMKYYEKPTDVLDQTLVNQIESMFDSRVNKIQAILDATGNFVCIFYEESYDYLGSIYQLAYATNGTEFVDYMSEQNCMLEKQYSENWYYYVQY